jgi:D-alanyl-lipoteichoic acid acyltransferase DltB (MBOAT superfamily)
VNPRFPEVLQHTPAAIGWLVLLALLIYFAGFAATILLVAIAIATYAVAARGRPRLITAAVVLHVLVFAALAISGRWPAHGIVAYGVVMCHAIAYLLDVRRGEADARQPAHAVLYLLQLPVLLAGPLSRYREFSAQLARSNVTLGAFAYGTRRVATGAIKALLIAGVLRETADAILASPIVRLTAAAAWLGAICIALQIYLVFSGFADIGIGLGRMVGLRYQENFRRPYTADSLREFWRRWNITLITWLRDYLSLPIAGQDEPTPRLYGFIIAGFCLVGLWHGGATTSLWWGVYSGTWLAAEAVWLGRRLDPLPRIVRHVYVLAVMTLGWVILRAPDVATAGQYLQTMAGIHRGPVFIATPVIGIARFTDWWVWTALALGAFAAGPLVPSVSRWRVSVDAATTSLYMMTAATLVFVWRVVLLTVRSAPPAPGAVRRAAPGDRVRAPREPVRDR